MQINNLKRNVLIMTDEVIFHASTDNTIDPRTVQQSIIVAEERFLRPFLGHQFYEALIAEKNKVVTAENKDELQEKVNEYFGNENNEIKVGDIINSSTFLSENNRQLWNALLWKYAAECVMIAAIPKNYAAFTSQGLVHNNPSIDSLSGSSVSTPTLQTAKWLVDKQMMDIISPLEEALKNWLCNNKIKFPLYESKNCKCEDELNFVRKTNFVLDVYEN